MGRSKWKGPYISDKKDYTEIKQRNSEIAPSFLGKTFKVYNGKSYKEITIVDEMIGHKFGEFFFTRAKFFFKKKKSKK